MYHLRVSALITVLLLATTLQKVPAQTQDKEAGQTAVQGADSPGPSAYQQRQNLIAYAISLAGLQIQPQDFVPHVADHAADVRLPINIQELFSKTEEISQENREPGDIIFLADSDDPDSVPDHAGIYLGLYTGPNQKIYGRRIFIHSFIKDSEAKVTISDADSQYWQSRIVSYARFLSSADPLDITPSTDSPWVDPDQPVVFQAENGSGTQGVRSMDWTISFEVQEKDLDNFDLDPDGTKAGITLPAEDSVQQPPAANQAQQIHSSAVHELTLDFSYCPLFALPVNGGIRSAMQLERSANFVPMSFGLKAEYIGAVLPKKSGFLGFGTAFLYSYMRTRREDLGAAITLQIISLDFYLSYKYQFKPNMAVLAHAGLGFMIVPQPQYLYDDGYIPQSDNWSYPGIMVGGAYQYNFTRELSLIAGLDFMTSLGMSVPFPVFKADVGLGWRLL